MQRFVRLAGIVCLGLALQAGPVVLADDDDDHRNELTQAVRSGEIMPLADVLSAVGPKLDGDIVGIEVEREDGLWVYELKVARPGGRIVKVYIDARTAEILKVKSKK